MWALNNSQAGDDGGLDQGGSSEVGYEVVECAP